jgi:hypothetical protein
VRSDHHSRQGGHYSRVELVARFGEQPADGLRRGKRVLVGPAADHHLVGFGRGDYARRQRYLLPRESLGVAAPIRSARGDA